jgi:hypothetical protein
MEIVGACDLYFMVTDLSVDTSFLVSLDLRFDVVLDRRWLKKYQLIHDYNLDCLYLGRESRRVFRSQALRKKLPGHNITWEKMQHGFPAEHQAELKRLLARHADIFYDSGPLQQTRFIKHDIVVTDLKPFRLQPYRYTAVKKKAIQEQVKEMLASGAEKERQVPFLRRFSALKQNHGGLRTTFVSNPRTVEGPWRSYHLFDGRVRSGY